MRIENRFAGFVASSNEHKILFFLIVAGILLRIYDVVSASAIDIDGIAYVEAARHFGSGAILKALSSERLPFFSAVIAFFHFFISDFELAGRLTSLVFGISLILFCFYFVKDRWGKEEAFWIAAFVSLHPYLVRYSARVLSESVAIFLFTSCFFCFYKGWIKNDRRLFGLAGLLLTFAYFTKAEYIVYILPLSIALLCRDGRRGNLLFFLACFLPIVLSFLVYLRVHTGVWIIDRRILSWGPGWQTGIYGYLRMIVSDPAIVFVNMPVVMYHFCEAVSLPFLLLAIIGFKKTDAPFRILAIALIACHVLARSFVLHSTKRYAVEFIPIVLVFAINGFRVVRNLSEDMHYGKALLTVLCFASVGILLFQGVSVQNRERKMEKEAGVLLGKQEAGAIIASRLPIVSFYANGAWTSLETMLEQNRTCDSLDKAISSSKARYISVDEKIEKSYPLIKKCITEPKFCAVIKLERGKKHLTVYRRQ